MAEKRSYFNGSGVSQVIDAAGHIVDAGDRIEASPRNPHIAPLVEAGLLTDVTDTSPGTGDDEGDEAESDGAEADESADTDDTNGTED